MNYGIARAGLIARFHREKTASTGDLIARGVLGAGQAAQTAGRGLTGAAKAWGGASKTFGKSVGEQLQRAGVRGAHSKGRMAGMAMKVAPVAVGGYYAHETFKPEIHSAKQRLGQALRGRMELFKARRRAAMPYYHEGRFQ